MGTTCLTVCPECNRHVRCGERDCPFCGARVSSFLRVQEYRLKARLGRGQGFSLGAALAAVGIATLGNDIGCAVYGGPCVQSESCEQGGWGAAPVAGSGGHAGSGGTTGHAGGSIATAGSNQGGNSASGGSPTGGSGGRTLGGDGGQMTSAGAGTETGGVGGETTGGEGGAGGGTSEENAGNAGVAGAG